MALWILWSLTFLVDTTQGECNQRYLVKTGQAIDVVSQNYPYNFSRDVHCFYDFIAEFNSGNVIHLKVQEVSLSCDDPKITLEVYDAFTTSPKVLGRVCQGNPMLFVSPRERMYLVFKSSGAGSNGFKLRVEAVPEFSHCYKEKTKIVNAYHHPQVITSPYYPFEVAPNVHCRWLIKAPPGHRVILDVKDINMKGSNDCNNFGLYVYDGKTNYDDERVGKLCDHETGMRSFTSSSVHLMVVFTSGPHVLLSGGGVRLTFRSSHDDEEPSKDHSLLFILIGVLLGVASYTVLMILLRYVIVPARRKHASRTFGPDRSASLTPLRSISVTSSISEPPPPYRATEDTPHATKRGVVGAISCHLVNLFKSPRAPTGAGPACPAFGAPANDGQYPTLDNYSFISDGETESAQQIGMTTMWTSDYRQLPRVPSVSSDGARESVHIYDTLSNVGLYMGGDDVNDAGRYQPVQSTSSSSSGGGVVVGYSPSVERNHSVSACPQYGSRLVGDADGAPDETVDDAADSHSAVGYENTVIGAGTEDKGGISQVPRAALDTTADVEHREGRQSEHTTSGRADDCPVSADRTDRRRRVDDEGYEIPSGHYDLPDETDVDSDAVHYL